MSLKEHGVSFGWKKTYSVRITSANQTFQLMRVPWPEPVQKRAMVTKVTVDNFNGIAGAAHIFDSDESSSTPPKRGSAGAALITVGVAAAGASGVNSSQTVRGLNELPPEVFRGGIAVQCTQINMQVSVECTVY